MRLYDYNLERCSLALITLFFAVAPFAAHPGLGALPDSVRLIPAANKIGDGALHVATGDAAVYPTSRNTVVYDRQEIVTYNLAGKEIHRVSLSEPLPGITGGPSAPSFDVLSTSNSRGFEKPRIYFVTESFYHPTIAAFLRVVGADGLISQRVPFVERTSSSVSPGGNYFVTFGDRSFGPAEMGIAETAAAGTFAVYDRNSRLVLQKGTPVDPYFFFLIHDNGRIVAEHASPGGRRGRLAMLRPDGSTLWEGPSESETMDTISLDFTADGEYVVEQRQASSPDRYDAQLEIRDSAGNLDYQTATPHPRQVRACGGGLVLTAELRNQTGNQFVLIDPAQKKAVSEFIVAGGIEDVRARMSPDGKTLYLALYFLDSSSNLRARLETRDLGGRLLAQRELGLASLSPFYLVFSDYGDGVHWLVPAEDSLWLLKP